MPSLWKTIKCRLFHKKSHHWFDNPFTDQPFLLFCAICDKSLAGARVSIMVPVEGTDLVLQNDTSEDKTITKSAPYPN